MSVCPDVCPHTETTFYGVACVAVVGVGTATLGLFFAGIKSGTVAREDGREVAQSQWYAYVQAMGLWCTLAAITGFFWLSCAFSTDSGRSVAFFYAVFILLRLSYLIYQTLCFTCEMLHTT